MPWRGYPSSPEYGKAAWKRARADCLKAAKWRCQLRLDGCRGAASEVDHIYGLASDPNHQHLRAVCKSCHGKITAQQGNDAKGSRPGRTAPDPDSTSRIIWE